MLLTCWRNILPWLWNPYKRMLDVNLIRLGWPGALLYLLLSKKPVSLFKSSGTRRRWAFLLPADSSSRADQTCPANLSLSSELGDVFNELIMKPTLLALEVCSKCHPPSRDPYQKVQKASRLYHIFTSESFISVHVLQAAGVCLCLSLCLWIVRCCDR